jgi:hypothetical protein
MAAVPPIVASASAQVALNEATDVVAPPMVRVCRSAKRLKVSETMHAAGAITEAEHGEHEAFHARCTAAAAGVVAGGGAPHWFAGALAAGLAPITFRLGNIEARLVNIEARLVNSVASDNTDPLQGLSNATGAVYGKFPANILAVANMGGAAMDLMLAHYGLGVAGTNNAKRQRLKKFIGMKIA